MAELDRIIYNEQQTIAAIKLWKAVFFQRIKDCFLEKKKQKATYTINTLVAKGKKATRYGIYQYKGLRLETIQARNSITEPSEELAALCDIVGMNMGFVIKDMRRVIPLVDGDGAEAGKTIKLLISKWEKKAKSH